MFSGILCFCLKEVKPLLVFDAEFGEALELMQGILDSSRVYLRNTELILLVAVTSGSL